MNVSIQVNGQTSSVNLMSFVDYVIHTHTQLNNKYNIEFLVREKFLDNFYVSDINQLNE